jgi:uncharacterized protein
MYALISHSTALHTEGAFYEDICFPHPRRSGKTKTELFTRLRFHVTQGWYDIYQPEATDDLHRFFDRDLKGMAERWEGAPRIRMSLAGYNRHSVVDRSTQSYPPHEFKFTTLYLDGKTGSMSLTQLAESGGVQYHASKMTDPGVMFTYTFDRYTEMCRLSLTKLYMSTEDHNDLDVYVVLYKMDKDGNLLEHINIPWKDLPLGTTASSLPNVNVFKYIGPNWRLRASHIEVMREPGLTEAQYEMLSDGHVWHPHDNQSKIKPGEVAELDIGLWPGGMVFDAGESIALVVKGSLPILPEHPGMAEKMANYIVGHQKLHIGGYYPSELKLYI